MVATRSARSIKGCLAYPCRARVRAFADGFVSVLLPIYLLELGLGVFAIGSIIAATLIGRAMTSE